MPVRLSENWETFVTLLREGLGDLARATVGDALDAARDDMRDFIAATEDKLRRWGDALADGRLIREDFESLLAGQEALARMHALTALGKTAARLERFRTGLLSLIVQSAMRAIGV